eukprot:gene1859-4956_t
MESLGSNGSAVMEVNITDGEVVVGMDIETQPLDSELSIQEMVRNRNLTEYSTATVQTNVFSDIAESEINHALPSQEQIGIESTTMQVQPASFTTVHKIERSAVRKSKTQQNSTGNKDRSECRDEYVVDQLSTVIETHGDRRIGATEVTTDGDVANTNSTIVYIVRHGQRLDEVPHNSWVTQCSSGHGRLYDPPLTSIGEMQARDAAAFIANQSIDADILYTSSLTRCVSTAAVIAKELNLKVSPCDVLAECAAAVRERTLLKTSFASDQEIATLIPPDLCLPRYTMPVNTFRSALVELCRRHYGRSFLICAHREAIRDLLAEQYLTAKVEYCAVVAFRYDFDNDVFEMVDARKDTVRVVQRPGSWW